MTKKQKIGVALIVVPPAVFVLNLVAFAIMSLVLSSMAASAPVDPATGLVMANSAGIISAIIRIILGFVGILAMVGTPVGFIAGLILLLSGGEQTAVVPPMPPRPHVPPTV